MNIVEILATYTILHITYTDMGMDIGDKYKKLVRHPYIIAPLLLATALQSFEYDLQSTILTVGSFYILMKWGDGSINIPLFDSLLSFIYGHGF